MSHLFKHHYILSKIKPISLTDLKSQNGVYMEIIVIYFVTICIKANCFPAYMDSTEYWLFTSAYLWPQVFTMLILKSSSNRTCFFPKEST